MKKVCRDNGEGNHFRMKFISVLRKFHRLFLLIYYPKIPGEATGIKIISYDVNNIIMMQLIKKP